MAAEPTGTTGVYEAAVVFPGAGTWSYEVDDGLVSTGYGESTTSTYAPVDVRPAAGGGDSDPFPVLPALGVVGAVALLAAAAFAVAASAEADSRELAVASVWPGTSTACSV